MKQVLNITIASLLLFNGIAAIYGGINFILYPDGSSLNIPLKYLGPTPFKSYLIPGIILFIVNGVSSILVFMALIRKSPLASGLVMMQGVLLTGWILVQVVLLQIVYPLHLWMGAVGLLLIILGGIRNFLSNDSF